MNIAHPMPGPALKTRAASPAMKVYYLHPLLAGPIAAWPNHFARVRAMGFSHVLIAPPFQPGRSGDLFLTADHDRLHPALGDGDATTALYKVAAMARAHDLALLLDIVLDRVAVESPLAPPWVDDGHPPDPRLPPSLRFTATLKVDTADVFDGWRDRLIRWLDAGITGFRCEAAHRGPESVWTALIHQAHAHDPAAIFIAWTMGAPMAAIRRLAPCGFDLAASSSWSWDFAADWLEADTTAIASVGRVLAMPEAPFAPRVTSRQASRRALAFASRFGEAWLMPMGFEYGAMTPLNPATGNPASFDALLAAPRFDLTAEVAAANMSRDTLSDTGHGTVISAPHAPVAAITRTGGGKAWLLLANPSLEQPATSPVTALLPRVAEVMSTADLHHTNIISLGPGEVRAITGTPPIPILSPKSPGRAIAAAITAPRIAIENIEPSVDGGRFPAKRRLGEVVTITADIICDGHDHLAAVLLWRTADKVAWRELPMHDLGNDVWSADLPLDRPGRVQFTIEAWYDGFGTYRDALVKRRAAGAPLELQDGMAIVTDVATATGNPAIETLRARLQTTGDEDRCALLLSEATETLLRAAGPRAFRVRHATPLALDVDRRAGSFASWYELFPRSQSGTPMRHGTFHDVIARLPAVRDMGFDVLYFPPIHPIGQSHRKGRDNRLRAEPTDPGSPYAIGSPDGGHDAIHPELGTIDDFLVLLHAATKNGLEIALDFAIQCSPDHPWLKQHPEWFAWRADGTVKHAGNPPKKYEDIVNVDFHAKAAQPALWLALRDIVLFWVNQGVRIFRVDNPHTKPLPFWAWMIADIRDRHPDVLFLAEAFTRPKMMYRLAKIGFSQSYTYFTWRDTAPEMRAYMTELTTTAPREFFRPHFFVNTPDINPIFLHNSGRPGFLIRAALAALLSGLWGVYNGFELCESASLRGREEYRDSEKYEIRGWDWNRPGNIIAEIRQLNHIRRTNPALHTHLNITFANSENDDVLCFIKTSLCGDNIIAAAISFDPVNPRRTVMTLPPGPGWIAPAWPPPAWIAEDLMRGTTEYWPGGTRLIDLDPNQSPFAVWRLRPGERTA